MENLKKLGNLVTFQQLYNREKEIKDLYAEEARKLEKLQGENLVLLSGHDELSASIDEMQKKVTDETYKRDDIKKRIASLEDNKDKIKIARQIKSWEKEMEKQQQELSLIQAQIDYDGSKLGEMRAELEKQNARIEENNSKINDLKSKIDSIMSEHREELSGIDKNKNVIRAGFDVQFIEYYEALLRKTKGSAIVEVDEDSCSGCSTVLPTCLQGELGEAVPLDEVELHQCPNCFRYLFYQSWLR